MTCSICVVSFSVLVAVGLAACVPAQEDPMKPGYTDTPKLPDSEWRVHDAERPHPPIVAAPVAPAPDQPDPPPSDAVVLFAGDAGDLANWTGRDGEAKWSIVDRAMQVNGTGDIQTREHFGDCQVHVEWRSPSPATGESQHRGNSGVFLMGRYEIQVLDSYDNVTYADGQAAALYGQYPPLVNVCRKPGEWQTYDIVFEAPRFEHGELVEPAHVTLFHNGVLVHLRRPLIGATAHRQVAGYTAHDPEAPIRLQDHGDPVAFRNLWVRRL